MSAIEKLKAEAMALRETEKAAGRVLKHCDALEVVARKHGYANWRACIAALAADTPASAVPEAPAVQIAEGAWARPSRRLGGESELARQGAFTRWLAPSLAQAAVDFSRNVGLVPIFSESSKAGNRYLFWSLPERAMCEVRSGRPGPVFLELDKRNREQGRRLLSLTISEDQMYSAVWISSDHYDPAVQHLGRFGIGPAHIEQTT